MIAKAACAVALAAAVAASLAACSDPVSPASLSTQAPVTVQTPVASPTLSIINPVPLTSPKPSAAVVRQAGAEAAKLVVDAIVPPGATAASGGLLTGLHDPGITTAPRCSPTVEDAVNYAVRGGTVLSWQAWAEKHPPKSGTQQSTNKTTGPAGVESAGVTFDVSSASVGATPRDQVQLSYEFMRTQTGRLGVSISSRVVPSSAQCGPVVSNRLVGSLVPAGPPAALASIGHDIATAPGSSDVTEVYYVETTENRALSAMDAGSRPGTAGSASVYLVVALGHFVDDAAPIPYGATPPTGTVTWEDIDRSTGQLLDDGVGSLIPDLSTLGPIQQLPIN